MIGKSGLMMCEGMLISICFYIQTSISQPTIVIIFPIGWSSISIMTKNDFTEYIEEANIVFLDEVNKCYVLHTIKKMNE